MNKPPDKYRNAAELRQKAERRLAAKPETATGKPIDQRRLTHELQVHQIELEMQNEELREARTIAETALARYAELFDFAPIAYFILGLDGIIQSTNFHGELLLGLNRFKLTGHHFAHSVSSQDQTVFKQFLEKVFASTGTQRCEITLRTGEDSCWAIIEATADINHQTCLAAVLDITEKKRAEDIIRQQANIDPLTGLPNRRLFLDRLQQAINGSHRADQKVALMLLDLDNFKAVNDTLGHDMGDRLLRECVQRMKSCIRETDTLARPGGDEFTLVMSELNEVRSIDRVAQCILHGMATPFQLKNEHRYISASIGIALYPDDADNMEDLLKKADQAMYAAKNQGGNHFCYFMPAMQEAAALRLQLGNDLSHALADNQLWVAYQPIVELTTGDIQKAEALLRWQHPTRGVISPAEFIPVAEDTGMITGIGDWAFHQVAHQVAIWRRNHHPQFQISVNKSFTQFHNNGDAHAAWLEHIERQGLPGHCIAVEITEQLLLDASVLVSEQLRAFRNAGMEISLDNFGTGYSSLSSLKKLDIDYLKIDQAFVCNLAANSTDLTMCEAIILVAHKLGIKVIAEGIETLEQRDLLIQAGCDYGQGDLFSGPMSAKEVEKLFTPKNFISNSDPKKDVSG